MKSEPDRYIYVWSTYSKFFIRQQITYYFVLAILCVKIAETLVQIHRYVTWSKLADVTSIRMFMQVIEN